MEGLRGCLAEMSGSNTIVVATRLDLTGVAGRHEGRFHMKKPLQMRFSCILMSLHKIAMLWVRVLFWWEPGLGKRARSVRSQ